MTPTSKTSPNLDTPPGFIRRWWRGHRRALRESLAMPWRAPLSTTMTIITLAISFFLPLLLWTLWMNTEALKDAWREQGSIAFFLKPQVNSQQAALLMHELKNNPVIESAIFIGPHDIQKQLEQDPQLQPVLQLIKNHNLPTQLLLKPVENASPEAIAQMIATARLNPKVDYISYDPGWLRQLEAAVSVIKAMALASALLFLVIVVVTLGNTVTASVAREQQEIRLLQLMGATNATIRRRFLYAGVIYGALAALLAWLCLLLLLYFFRRPVQQLANSYGTDLVLMAPDGWQTLGYFACALGITWLATRLALQFRINEAT